MMDSLHWLTIDELIILCESIAEQRSKLHQFLQRPYDYTPEQRSQVAAMLAKTEFFDENKTLEDLLALKKNMSDLLKSFSTNDFK